MKSLLEWNVVSLYVCFIKIFMVEKLCALGFKNDWVQYQRRLDPRISES